MSRADPDPGSEDCEGTGETPFPNERYAWYVVWVLMLFYVLSFVDRQIIALLVEPMKADLGLSDIQVSLLGGLSFVVFYTLFGIPMGRLADSVSRRGIIGIGVAVWSAMTTLCGFATRFSQLLFLRMGVGVGEAALSPAAFSLIADYFPKRRLATALSVYSMGIFIGSGLAFTGGAIIFDWATALVSARGGLALPVLGEVRPWQIVFFCVGLPGVFLSFLLFTVKEPERRGALVERDANGENRIVRVPVREVARYFWKNRWTVCCHNLGLACLSLAGYSAGFWDLAFLGRTYGWSPGQGGIWYGLVTMAAGALGVYSGGYFADFLLNRGYKSAKMLAILVAAVIWLPFGIAYPLMPTPTLALVMLFPTLFAGAMPWGCAAAAIQEMMPPQMRGQASAIYLFVINIIGLGIGPTLVAFLTEHVFADLLSLRYSILCVGTGAHILAAIILGLSLRPYVETLARAADWGGGKGNN